MYEEPVIHVRPYDRNHRVPFLVAIAACIAIAIAVMSKFPM